MRVFDNGHSFSGVHFSIHSKYSAIQAYDDAMKAAYGDRFFYILYFQEVGPADEATSAEMPDPLQAQLATELIVQTAGATWAGHVNATAEIDDTGLRTASAAGEPLGAYAASAVRRYVYVSDYVRREFGHTSNWLGGVTSALDDAGYHVPWERIQAAVSTKTRLIVINTPQQLEEALRAGTMTAHGALVTPNSAMPRNTRTISRLIRPAPTAIRDPHAQHR